jgi:hypothetical protein
LGDQYWIAGQLAELGFGREARLLRLRPSCACKGTCGSNASPSAIESLKSATNGELPELRRFRGEIPGFWILKGPEGGLQLKLQPGKPPVSLFGEFGSPFSASLGGESGNLTMTADKSLHPTRDLWPRAPLLCERPEVLPPALTRTEFPANRENYREICKFYAQKRATDLLYSNESRQICRS